MKHARMITMILLAAALTGSLNAEPDQRRESERGWHAERPEKKEYREDRRVSQDDDDDRPPMPERPYREGMAGPLADGPLMRFARLREEADKLAAAPGRIAREREELAKREAAEKERKDGSKGDKLGPDRIARRKKMLDLREQLLELDRAEFVDKTKSEAARIGEEFADRRERIMEHAPAMAERVESMLEKMNDAKTFDEVRAAMDELPTRRPSPQGDDGRPPVDRMRREMEALRQRLDAIQRDLDGVGEVEDWDARPPRPMRGEGPERPGRPPQPPPPPEEQM
ncbi:hypothetical protein GC173_15065 [bacterium]|nr:hypothetical protein [bacterium]